MLRRGLGCVNRARGGRTEVAESAVKPGSVVDNHSSRPSVTARLKQHTRGRVEPTHSPPIWPCSEWGLPCPATLSPQAVGSYPTVSPLPRMSAFLAEDEHRSAVYSLLHWPSARAAQALPGTLLCGARTFLGAVARVAVVLADSAEGIVGPRRPARHERRPSRRCSGHPAGACTGPDCRVRPTAW